MTEFRAAALEPAAPPPRFVADTPPVLVGMSTPMDRLRVALLRAAAHERPVLVAGEPGSGKSLVARALHEQGPRADQRSVVVACQAFPDTLLEIELFGCAKGVVAGATCDRQGVLEMVNGGTVILENIEAMSARIQASLERFLTSGRVHAVGTIGAGTPIDTRVVATSAKPPADDPHGRHHAPLWRRLHDGRIDVPNLRTRQPDIPLLAHYFASGGQARGHGAVFAPDAMAALVGYPWPGNVSQLRSVVERLATWTGPREIQATDLPVGIRPRVGRAARDRHASVGEELLTRVQTTGESFWSTVYPLFMKREITRTDLRDLVRRALAVARGNTDDLMRVLNMPGSDGPKFTRFLRKYGCELNF